MDRSAVGQLLDARRDAAFGLLRQAVRLDLARFLSSEVEARLRARPHFAARTPRSALIALRQRLDAGAVELSREVMDGLTGLETWYRGQEVEESEEAAAVARVFSPAVEAASKLLVRYGFPSDDAPDAVDDPGLDLSPSYSLSFAPSDTVLWAWRQLRELDAAGAVLLDGAAGDTFEVRFHTPEALPED